MPVDILVPPLSQTMDTLILTEWVRQPGDAVVKGDVLFRVETDKATLEVESPGTGIIKEVFAQAGDEIKVRSSIGTIVEPGEDVPASSPLSVTRVFASPRARKVIQGHGITLSELRGLGTGPRQMVVERDVTAYLEQRKPAPRVTPLAERVAKLNQVNLAEVSPTQPGGKITRADVEAVLKGREPQLAAQPVLTAGGTAEGPERISLTPLRRTLIQRLQQSHTAAIPVTYQREIDATRLVKMRERVLEKLPSGSARPTYTDFLIRALCLVLPRHPDLNATFDGEILERWKQVNLALAIDTERGLMAPVLRGVQGLGVSAIAAARSTLVQKALSGGISAGDISGGTFTLSNLGALNVDAFTPVLNPPQTAILGVGRIRQAPAAHKGKLRLRSLLSLSLTCDHRIIDGAPAARFLDDLSTLLESPDLIWL